MSELWNVLFQNPMINALLVFSQGLWASFGLGVISLTIIVRILIYPMTRRQLQAQKAMTALQPKINELKKKYGKDRKKLSEETMKLYQEHKISPLGCVVPMLVQIPIFIALYFSIRNIVQASAIGEVPGLYSWSIVHQELPNMNFLWMHLGNTQDFPLALLAMFSMYAVMKMGAIGGFGGGGSPMASADPKQAQLQRIMALIFPLMLGFITLSLPSGVGLYFVVSNIIGIIMQYFVTGWGALRLPEPIRERIPVDRLPSWMRRTGTANPSPPTIRQGAEDGKHREKR